MLFDILFLFIGSILEVLGTALGAVSYVIPSQVADSMSYLASFTLKLQPIFPMTTFWACIGALVTFTGILMGVKVTLWAYARIPFLGKGR